MTYKITIRKKAVKELEKLPLSANRKISSDIDSLAEEPHPIGCKKLKGNRKLYGGSEVATIG